MFERNNPNMKFNLAKLPPYGIPPPPPPPRLFIVSNDSCQHSSKREAEPTLHHKNEPQIISAHQTCATSWWAWIIWSTGKGVLRRPSAHANHLSAAWLKVERNRQTPLQKASKYLRDSSWPFSGACANFEPVWQFSTKNIGCTPLALCLKGTNPFKTLNQESRNLYLCF